MLRTLMNDARGGPIRYPSLWAAIESIAPKFACGIDAMNGEHGLGKIDSDGDNGHRPPLPNNE